MDSRRIGIVILVSALAVAGCATSQIAAAAAPPDGKVEGALTINGKTFPLKYVYTGTKDKGEFEVLIANEPVPLQTLSKIFLELSIQSFARKESKVLKGSTLKALYFTGYKFQLNPDNSKTGGEVGVVSCEDSILMTSDTFFHFENQSGSTVRLEGVRFNDGTLSAKARYKWEQTETVEDQDIKIIANYAVSFEAKIQDESLLARSFSSENKAWQASLAALPQEGTAQGDVKLPNHAINLTHAYAMRQKSERFGEVITLLLTDKPVPKEYLLFSFERSATPLEISGLFLNIDESGSVRNPIFRHLSGQQPFDDSQMKSFKLENGKAIGAAEGKWNSRSKDDSATYSVTFDAPLKK